MTAHCCPTCGQAVSEPPTMDALADGPFSRQQRIILRTLIRAHPRPVSLDSFVAALYETEADGGATDARGVVRTQLVRIRSTLPAYGWRIPSLKGGAGNFGQYRLEKIDA